jgi:hypothetical protein
MAQPFTNCSDPVIDNVSLVIEHNHWNPNVPGVGSGTAISLTVGGQSKHNVMTGETDIGSPTIDREPIWRGISGAAPDSTTISEEQAYRGTVSTKVVTTSVDDGVSTQILLTNSLERTFRVWVYVEFGQVEVFMSDPALSGPVSATSTTTGEWEEITVTATKGTSTGIMVGLRADVNPTTWYFDWPQLYVQDSYPLFDEHASESSLFVSNKQRHDGINYVYAYNNGSWTSNLMFESSTPITIGGRLVDEGTYFGIEFNNTTSTYTLDNGGTFDNLILNVSRAAAGIAYAPTWEYYNGSAWVDLDTVVDKTSFLQETGETSVGWLPPSNWDFGALNAIISAGEGSASAPTKSAYWIRLLINAGVTISEANRPQISALPYTVVWPYIDLGSTTDLIGGDIEANGKVDITNYGGDSNTTTQISVAAQNDDTYFDTTIDTNNFSSTVLETGTDFSAGMRFLSIPITANSNILSAYITLVAADSAGQGVVRTNISCHDVDDSGALNGYNLAAWLALPRTSSKSWSLDGTTGAGQKFVTPNIGKVINLVTDRPGWVSGNDITIFIDDDVSDGTAEFTFASYDNVTYDAPELTIIWADENGGVWINKCIAGVRDTSRGEYFLSHINMSDLQEQPGVEVVANTASYFTDDTIGAGGRAIIIDSSTSLPWPVTSPGEISDDEYNIIVRFGNISSASYVGTYRAFLRFSSDLTGTDTASFSIAVRSGSTGITKFGYTSAEFGLGLGSSSWAVRPTASHSIIPVDLGLITIPENPFGYDRISLLISGSSSDTTAKLTVYDVILIPADEWIGEISTGESSDKYVYALESIHFDSLSSPRRSISAYHMDENGVIKAMLNTFASRLVMSPTTVQRMFFLFNTIEREDSVTEYAERSSPWGLVKVAASALGNYLTMRGAG